MVDVGLRKVSVVLNLRAHKRRAVVGDDHKLGLALAEGLEGLVEAKAVLAALHDEGELGVDTLLGLLLFLDDHFCVCVEKKGGVGVKVCGKKRVFIQILY